MKTERRLVGLAALGVAAITWFVFGPVVHNGLVFLDDAQYLEEAAQHPRLSVATVGWAFTATEPFYYHPLSRLSHIVDWQLWGANLEGHHATSLVIHGVNAGLVVLVAWVILSAAASLTVTERLVASAAVGLIFGIHPLQVESVAWLAERKNVLCGFFSLACLYAWLRVAREEGPAVSLSTTHVDHVILSGAKDLCRFGPLTTTSASNPQTARSFSRVCGIRMTSNTKDAPDSQDGWRFCRSARAWWWATTLLFVAALLSKPMAVALPVVMLALDYYPLRRAVVGGWGRLLREKAVLFALAFGLGCLTLISQARVGAVTDLARQGMLPRVLVAVRACFFYLWKLVWPVWLCPYYPLEGQVRLFEPEFLAPVILAGLAVALVVWQRKRVPAVVAAGLAFAGLLVPTSGILQSGPQAAADRFMYLAIVPPLLVLAWSAVWAVRHLTVAGRTALGVLLACESVFFGFATRGQIGVWHDPERLWRHVLAYYPQSGFANCELGEALARQGRFAEALAPARAATALTPGFARAHLTLGYVYLKLGNPSGAVTELAQVSSGDPAYGASRYQLACAYTRLGRFDLAWGTLRQVVAADSGWAAQAAVEPELRSLRDDPRYQTRFHTLVAGKVAPE